MKLYVMRHGPAEDDASDGLDSSRALTGAGRERVRLVAKRLVDLGESPKLIVSSSLVRAIQTAEIMHATLGTDVAIEVASELSPRGDCNALVRRLVTEKRRRVMLIGHEPDLSMLCSHLHGEPLTTSFMKAMVVSLRVAEDETDAVVRFVLDPKSLDLVLDTR